MFVVDVMSRVPVYEQIIKQVEEQVLTGILKEGDKLPSVRSLSVKLSINPNTIQKAYTELDRRQLIITVPGKGSFISEKAIEVVGANSREKMTELNKIIRELALAGVTKEEIINSIEEGDKSIIPNIVAINVLDSFDDLRMNLNRVLNNSDWANESCLILLNVEDEEVELLERFAIHHNVSMIMVKENDIITVNQKNILDINHTYLFKSLKNKDFSEMIHHLSNSLNEANAHYEDIVNAFKYLTNK